MSSGRYNRAELDARAIQAWVPGTGVEQSQGDPYAGVMPPQVRAKLQVPGDPGINIKGWSNPYKMTFYGFSVPDQASESSIVALAGNFKRAYLLIQNKGPGNLFVNFGTEAAPDGVNCLQLVSTQVYEIIGGGGVFPDRSSPLISSFIPRDSVYILSDTAGTTCTIGEGIWTATGPVLK